MNKIIKTTVLALGLMSMSVGASLAEERVDSELRVDSESMGVCEAPIAQVLNWSEYIKFLDEKRSLFVAKTYSKGKSLVRYREAFVGDSSSKRSLVIYLHGSSGRGTDNAKHLNDEHGQAWIVGYLQNRGDVSCYVLMPQLPSGTWDSQCENLKALIDHYVASDSLIDKDRIYICGTSLGGGGTWNMLRKYPKLFKAAMPVAMRMSGRVSDYKGMKICYVTGKDEGNRSQDAKAMEQAGANVKYWYRQDAGHGETCQKSFTKECLDWLFDSVNL